MIPKRNNNKSKGSSSILVIMIVLMLVIFGVLGTLSAYSSLKLSEKNARYTNLYYDLESKAQEVKAIAIQQMQDAADYAIEYRVKNNTSDNQTVYYDTVREKLSKINHEAVSEEILYKDLKNQRLQWKVTFQQKYPSGPEQFSFEMDIPYPKKPIESKEDIRYTIVSWKKIPKEMQYQNGMEFQEIPIDETEGEQP